MSSFTDRYARAVQADTPAWIAEVVRRYGHSPGNVARLLDLSGRLMQPAGYTLTADDVAMLKEIHPNAPAKHIEAMAAALNKEPARTRASAFIGVMASDEAAMRGDVHLAGDAYRHVEGLVREHVTNQISDELNRRRGGGEDIRDDPSRHPEPGSTRAILIEQFKGQPRREMEQALERDDPAALDFARQEVANGIEQASNYLARGGGDSIRDTLEAAVDLHQGEAIARDTFGIE